VYKPLLIIKKLHKKTIQILVKNVILNLFATMLRL